MEKPNERRKHYVPKKGFPFSTYLSSCVEKRLFCHSAMQEKKENSDFFSYK
jgi:hypothetical protein